MGLIDFKKLGVSGKVNLVVCLIVFIGFFVLSAILLTNIYQKSVENAYDYAKKESDIGSKLVEGNIGATKNQIFTIKETIRYAKYSKKMDRKDLISFLESNLKTSPNVLGLYTAWEANAFDNNDSRYINKRGHDSTGRFVPYAVKTENGINIEPLVDYDKDGAGDYYQIPKKTGMISLIDPYTYKIGGKDVYLTSLVVPIMENNKFVGLVGADFMIKPIQDMMAKMKPMGGYTALITGSGVIIAHGLDEKFIFKDAKTTKMVNEETLEKIKNGKQVQEIVHSDLTNSDVLRVFYPVHIDGTNNYWSFISVIPKAAILKDFYFYLNLLIFVLIALTVVIVVINISFINKILNPLKIVNKALIDISEGNLTAKINESELSNDEIGMIGHTLNLTVNKLRDLIGSVTKSVEDISASSQEMSASADQTAQGAQQTANSTQQLAQGTQNISSNVEHGATAISKMNDNIADISEHAKLVAKLGNDSESNANEGNQYVKKAVGKIDNIKTVVGEISVTISELGKLSSSIEQIVDLIKNIAGQTNLLALNAAIEAARAGEHGKGFAVVADEVKKLATQSAQATDNITEMIKEIQNKTGVAVRTMEKTTQEVDEGVTVVNEAGRALESIIDQVKAANIKIQDITKQIEGISVNSQEVVSMIENVSAVTEETASSAEEISSITEEQTASLEEISASSQTLAKIAESLNKQVSIFKL